MACDFLLLKHMAGSSDKEVMVTWVYHPCYQYLYSETHAQRRLPVSPIILGDLHELLGREQVFNTFTVLDTALRVGATQLKILAQVCVKHTADLTSSNLLLKALQVIVMSMLNNSNLCVLP